MSDARRCDYRNCRRSLALVPSDDVVMHRESTGFGAHNERLTHYCGLTCRARAFDRDPVIERTQQTTLVAFDETARDAADRIAYSR